MTRNFDLAGKWAKLTFKEHHKERVLLEVKIEQHSTYRLRKLEDLGESTGGRELPDESPEMQQEGG